MSAYGAYFAGQLANYHYPESMVQEVLKKLPQVNY